jgi:GT2 family glycosyltransferase
MIVGAARSKPRVTIAILNYDGRELLDLVVPHVLAQRYVDKRILIVDNGSRDGSAEHVKTRWSAVEVLSIPENIGVAAALNRAVAASRSEFLALLNNDVELEPRWLDELVAALDAHPEAASASGKLLRYYDRDIIDAAGDLMLWSGAVVNRGSGEPDCGQFDQPQAVFAACAGAALYRRRAFEVVGPFDESFFAYLEDIDWSIRAQLAGLGSRYVPTAVGYHMRGATTDRQKGYYGRLQRRNQLLLVVKNFPSAALLRHGWKIAIHQLLWLAASARERMFQEHLRTWGELVLKLPDTLRARRVIQRSRVAGMHELDAIIIASLPSSGSRVQRLLYELAPATMSRHQGTRGVNVGNSRPDQSDSSSPASSCGRADT